MGIRSLPFLIPILLLGTVQGQELDSLYARVGRHLRALPTSSDVRQDSLDILIATDVRHLLERPDAGTLPMEALPMTRVDAPDGAFRLLTWNLPRNDGGHVFHGLLLHLTERGPVIHELKDQTSRIPSPEVPELSAERWYGALYYEVIPVKKGGRTLYTLLGWKGYSRAETRKVIEVLSFKGGKPRFGAPVFGKGRLKAMRKVYGFSFQVSMALRYDPDLGAIVMDHLSPSRADMKDQWAFYGPDMTQDAYFWHKGEWWFGADVDLRAPQRRGKP
jgi:hypothetical protein